LAFVAEAKGVGYEEAPRQVREVMELTQITHVSDRLIRNLSKGYRQRVGIAQALLGEPEVIILDEPTVGLDPKQIIEIRELIRRLGETKTVIVSSHILAEISAVCDHVMILSHGKLVANDSLAALEESAMEDSSLTLAIKGEIEAASKVLEQIEGVRSIVAACQEHQEGICRFVLDIDAQNDPRDTIFYTLAEMKMPIVEIFVHHATLEDIFLRLTSDEFFEEQEDEPTKNTADYVPQFVTIEQPNEDAKKEETNE
ncbi:MAG: ABC transporter ATP-binding protein, partial [Clostridia bacterium]|nr:ABC transporter ATP-binding protein [Clostridia bacterium]